MKSLIAIMILVFSLAAYAAMAETGRGSVEVEKLSELKTIAAHFDGEAARIVYTNLHVRERILRCRDQNIRLKIGKGISCFLFASNHKIECGILINPVGKTEGDSIACAQDEAVK